MWESYYTCTGGEQKYLLKAEKDTAARHMKPISGKKTRAIFISFFFFFANDDK